jgi:hypothetical protein
MSVLQTIIKSVLSSAIQSVLGVIADYTLSPSRTSYSLTVGDSFTVPTLKLKGAESLTAPTSNTVNTSVVGSYAVTWTELFDEAGGPIDDVIVTVIVSATIDQYGFNVWQSFNNWG